MSYLFRTDVMVSTTPQKQIRLFSIIYALILVFSFFGTYNKIFDKKLEILGDNVHYYTLGQSLAEGKGYVEGYSGKEVKHVKYPPVYPAVIAFFSKYFSNDYVFIKRCNGFFFLTAVGLLFFLVYKITLNIHIAFLTGLYTLFNFHMMHFSGIMMSEMLFIVLSLIALILMISIDLTKVLWKNWQFWLILIVISLAYHTRSAGLALYVAFVLFVILKKKWWYAIASVTGFIVLALPWYLRNSALGKNSYVRELLMKNPYKPEEGGIGLLELGERFFSNLSRYVSREIPAGIYNLMATVDHQTEVSSKEWVIGIVTLAVMTYGLVKLKKTPELVIDLYYLFNGHFINMADPVVWNEVYVGIGAGFHFFINSWCFGTHQFIPKRKNQSY